MRGSLISRRHVLRSFAGSGVISAFPNLVPRSVFGQNGRPAPSERVTLAVIGAGGQGTTDMRGFLQDDRVQVVAVCDVEKESDRYNKKLKTHIFGREPGRRVVNEHYAKQDGKRTSGQSCDGYEDFREVLARKDIDAVLVATPDHWHVLASVAAARAGKHVYCEKPVSLTVAEGRFLSDTVTKSGVVWQTGSQQRSDIHFRMACEFIRNGRLGKIQRIVVGLASHNRDNNGHAAEFAPSPPPASLNFDLWLGPCAEAPYCPARLHSNWRWLWAHAGGNVTDFGAHHLDIVQWALGKELGGPVEIFNPKPEWPVKDAFYQTPELFAFEVRYASGVTVLVTDDVANPSGIRFEGEGGKSLFVSRGKIIAEPKELLQEAITDKEIRLPVSTNHYGNFIDGILKKQLTVAPVEVGHRSASVAHLGNLSLRLGRTLKWNPETETIIGDAEASAMLSRPMRGPWKLV